MDRDEALADTAMSPGLASERTATLAATSPEAPAAKAIATRMLGRYRLEKELGVGGMGIVHAAFDPELERRVAIKLILRATTDEAKQRLLREARAMARLTHPNIVRIYEIGSEGGRDFVTMELIDGGSLADWLRSTKRSTSEVIDAFIAAGRGLAAAHEAGVIHRDFKPHNVLRSSSGQILVGDFGLATGLDTQAPIADIPVDGFATLTATGTWVGTPAYMAPEQWNGGAITPATDQFAFCVALWEALAGERPFRGNTVEELRSAVTAGPAKLDASKLPLRLRPVLRRGLDPDPAKRWPTMTALITALRPDRKKLYLGGAAIAGLALSASVVALALTRGGPDDAAVQVADQQRAIANRELERFGEQFAREGQRQAERGIREASREIERALRTSGIKLDLDLLGQVTRTSSGKVMAPQDAIGEVLDEIKESEAIRLVPTKNEGEQVIGFKAYRIKPASFVSAIGLSNGDLVTAIGGHPLTSENALAEALDQIDPDVESLALEILRGDVKTTIVVEARDELPRPSEVPGRREPPEPPEPPQFELRRIPPAPQTPDQ